LAPLFLCGLVQEPGAKLLPFEVEGAMGLGGLVATVGFLGGRLEQGGEAG